MNNIFSVCSVVFINIFNIYRNPDKDNRKYLDAAVKWLLTAQDAQTDGGVSGWYDVVASQWSASYPETTGYIIPTFLDYFHLTGTQEYKIRALKMADWEISIQMSNGALQGGLLSSPQKTPVVFNTGQVLYGLIAAFQETKENRYLSAAIKAADWLVSIQADDGSWKEDITGLVSTTIHSFNTRTAYGLLQLYKITFNATYLDHAIQNIDFALTQQFANGWFKNNVFCRNEVPLLHTISYAVEGILDSGILLNNPVFINAAKKTADKLLQLQIENGALYGRYNDNWEPTVRWSCMTGNAQVSIVWLKLYQIFGDPSYLQAALKINSYLKKHQILYISNKGVRGGISGSQPVWGGYMKFAYLNWAVKFFIDALMLEDNILRKLG